MSDLLNQVHHRMGPGCPCASAGPVALAWPVSGARWRGAAASTGTSGRHRMPRQGSLPPSGRRTFKCAMLCRHPCFRC